MMQGKPVYLDHNATTPVLPQVTAAVTHALKGSFGNPSSSHRYGLQAKAAVDDAREKVAGLLHARPEEIIFTSGGTESNNMALLGTAHRFRKGHIISSCIEHPSVSNVLSHLEDSGFRVTRLPVDSLGAVDADMIERHLRKDTILISLMHANNETGTIQPVAAAGLIAREHGIAFHCDAAQSVGKIPVNVRRMNVDLLTVAAHKLYGPKGVGALYIRKGSTINPILYGASHERGLRPGTENVPEIAGLGAAADAARGEIQLRKSSMKHLSGIFVNELKKGIAGVRLNGHPSKRLPNTLNLSFPNVSGAALLDRASHSVAASTGSACHAGSHSPSAVLTAMGISDEQALSAIRFSLGQGNTERQIRAAARALVKAYRSF